MPIDIAELVRRDHDDLAAGLDIIGESTTPRSMLQDGLDAIRLGFIVHAVAERRVFKKLAQREPLPIVTDLVMSSKREHLEHELILEDLVDLEIGTPDWFGIALELRESIWTHAIGFQVRWSGLRDILPSRLYAKLSSDYATERMRVLATTNPLILAAG